MPLHPIPPRPLTPPLFPPFCPLSSLSTSWIDPSRDKGPARLAALKIRQWAATITGIHGFDRMATSELQLVKYERGQEYQAHYDGRMLPNGKLEARGTFLVYLNDEFEGGETYFPNINVKVGGEEGWLQQRVVLGS